MDLTAEERAVLAKVCEQVGGHQFDLSQLIRPLADGQTLAVRAGDEDSLPHISCTRCFRVWLVVAEGESYEAAEQGLNGRLAPAHRIRARAERRAERAARRAARDAENATVLVPKLAEQLGTSRILAATAIGEHAPPLADPGSARPGHPVPAPDPNAAPPAPAEADRLHLHRGITT